VGLSSVLGSVLKERDQLLRGNQGITAPDKFFDFSPIDGGKIEAKPNPASWTNVGRKIEFARVGLDEPLIISGEGLTTNAHDLVSVMIVEIVGKYFLSNQEAGVVALVQTRGFGKSQAYLCESG
jgi:hypothetical protein